MTKTAYKFLNCAKRPTATKQPSSYNVVGRYAYQQHHSAPGTGSRAHWTRTLVSAAIAADALLGRVTTYDV